MTYAPAPRFEIARVISRMAGVIGRNAWTFLALALLLSGLPAMVAAGLGRGVASPLIAGPFVGPDMGWLLGVMISALLQAALIHGTVVDLNGGRATLEECLGTAWRHVLPLIGIGVVSAVASILGLFLFIVPGVIIALSLCVAAPARVIEGLGVFGALSRSGDLTRGHRGAILLLFVLYGIGFLVVSSIVSAIPLAALLIAPDAARLISALIIAPLIQTLGALVGAAGVASIYFELRTIKEGIGVEALAAAFD